jgi:hypothetical protein
LQTRTSWRNSPGLNILNELKAKDIKSYNEVIKAFDKAVESGGKVIKAK